ncbi:GNAT family N-acetyltransferase [Pseudomonas oryzihabitans]|uniref:GNAT family N-acetyltransferase n=1 Tax=Pseudomonas oryzihabitans TaxID=47885 RepID=UPI0028945076|nr:GNAT family N-acetyltransferase [Pseudomonas oryzihabitans]MDT3720198.1 GNAT family N-acetyltransferase [Pseudomonas oryzihabitans]
MTVQPPRGLLRLATLADVDALFAIRTAVADNALTQEQLADLGITPDAIATALATEPCAWVLERSGEVVGFSMVDLAAGEVFALFVRPACQGQGIGSRLLAAAETVLFRRHALIWLVTDGAPSVGANAFYRARGWQQVAQLEGTDVRYEKRRPLERDARDIA